MRRILRPSKTSKLGQTINDIIDELERLQPVAGPNERIEQTTRGTARKVRTASGVSSGVDDPVWL